MEQSDQFDLFVQRVDGLPGVRHSAPTTVRSIHPLTGVVSDHVIQTFRLPDEGFVITVARTDAGGHYRIVLPGKVAETIYRQRQRLTDRSTPQSRERKRKAAAARRERERRAARRAARQKSES
jgi:hypothetical protein